MSYKTAEFKLHNDCTGLHAHFNSSPTASSLGLDQTAVGRLLAFDTDGKYMLTCAPNSALMYLVSLLFLDFLRFSCLEIPSAVHMYDK